MKFIALDVSAGDLGDGFEVPDNLYCAVYQEELCGYMAGYAAVKMGYTKLGFLGGMAVLDRIVDDHQSVAFHRPRDIARPLLLTVGILRAQLLHLQVHLQRVRRGVERRLIVHQEDDVLALDDLFVSVSFRHKRKNISA